MNVLLSGIGKGRAEYKGCALDQRLVAMYRIMIQTVVRFLSVSILLPARIFTLGNNNALLSIPYPTYGAGYDIPFMVSIVTWVMVALKGFAIDSWNIANRSILA